MDSTIIATAAGIIGGILGAVVGGVFALKATKRQVAVMMKQAQGDVNERLYSQSLEIMKFFAENPEVRPYFYDNKDISRAANEMERLKVLSTSEMVAGFMELVAMQMEDQRAEIQPRWKAYIVDQYQSSSVMREHIAACKAWYVDDFLNLLPSEAMKPATEKTV